MQIGIDSFTLHPLNLTPLQMLDFAAAHGLAGVQFGGIRGISPNLDPAELAAFRGRADALGLYTHTGVSPINPVIHPGGADALVPRIREEIAAAARCGWRELHTVINVGNERYEHPVPWPAHVDGAIRVINRLRPDLERHACRVNIETHIETTFDILAVIEATAPHLAGVCLDTANTLVNAEDPLMAARRVAPYTHLTHAKDAIVYFTDEGVTRQGKPPGQGVVDFESILPVLAQHNPNLPLSIEDHKWLFTARVYDEDWLARNPDLTPLELARFIQLAWSVQKKFATREIPPPDEYEAPPFADELESRIAAGRDYLNALVKRLGLG